MSLTADAVGGQPVCFALTGTATSRLDKVHRERLQRPEDLAAWITTTGFGLPQAGLGVDDSLLHDARELREAIYRAARNVATGSRPDKGDRQTINEWAARNDAVRVLDEAQAQWHVPAGEPAKTILALIAADAVDTLGGAKDGTIKVCAGEQCVAVFLDTSRGRTRRWCSMGTCGNRAKRSAMRTRRA